MSNLHAHVSSTSRDCDGQYDRDHVLTMTDEEIADAGKAVNAFGEIHFQNRVLGNIVSMHGLGGTLNVRTYSDDFPTLDWHEQTEEGYRAVEARFCKDECDEAAYSQRDHSAEAANY